MSDKIQLEIVTPHGRALRVVVDEVTAPSVKGEFGVLPGHLPLLAALRTGLVTYRQGSDTTKCAVGPGFAEAGPDKLLMLTDDYVERDKLDPIAIRKELAEVQVEIARIEATSSDNVDDESQEKRRILVQRENWLAAELELYGDPPPATMRPHEEWGPTPSPLDEEAAAHE